METVKSIPTGGIGFEKARDNLIASIHKNEQANPEKIQAPEITAEDEYRILAGKGIEYIADGYKLYVPPMKIRQMSILKEVGKIEADPDISVIDKVFAYCEILAKVLKVPKDDLLDNLEPSDIRPILDLLIYSVQKGKQIFFKKKITVQEVREVGQAVSLARKPKAQ